MKVQHSSAAPILLAVAARPRQGFIAEIRSSNVVGGRSWLAFLVWDEVLSNRLPPIYRRVALVIRSNRAFCVWSGCLLLYWQLLYQCMVQITIDAYDWLLPDLVGHDRRLASFIIYLYLYRQASQQANWSVRLSHQSIANASGLSRSAVQSALAHLQNRQLIVTSRAHPTAVPLHRVHRPWLRLNQKRS